MDSVPPAVRNGSRSPESDGGSATPTPGTLRTPGTAFSDSVSGVPSVPRSSAAGLVIAGKAARTPRTPLSKSSSFIWESMPTYLLWEESPRVRARDLEIPVRGVRESSVGMSRTPRTPLSKSFSFSWGSSPISISGVESPRVRARDLEIPVRGVRELLVGKVRTPRTPFSNSVSGGIRQGAAKTALTDRTASTAGGVFSRRVNVPGFRSPARAKIRFRCPLSFGCTQHPYRPSG